MEFTVNGFFFHPREVAFCGYSGSGKTTLIVRLLKEMSATYRIGYVKHDAHHFDMDIAGKDTHRARENGAECVVINDPEHWAIVGNGVLPLDAVRALYAGYDMVFVEGYKNAPIRKCILIDEREAILADIAGGKIDGVEACIGAATTRPDLQSPYFHRDDIYGIKRHILKMMELVAPERE